VAAPQAPQPPVDAEDQARAWFEDRQKYFERVWKSGLGGKTFAVLVLLSFSAPFIFELFAVFAVWWWIWPATSSVTEKLATLSFLFVVLNVIAWQAARWGGLFWEYAYITRPKRWRKKPVS
jgi:hypothetical protein